MPRMGGPFYTKSHELHDQLEELGPGHNGFYDNVVRNAIVLEDWEEEGSLWVRGTFRANKMDIWRWQGEISRRTSQRRLTKILEAGIFVENEDGSYDIPRYKKRANEGVRVAEVKLLSQKFGKMEKDIEEIKIILQTETDPPDGENEGNDQDRHGRERPDMGVRGRKEATRGRNPASDAHPISLLSTRKKDQEEEEEATGASKMEVREQEIERGSREWLLQKIDHLWPGRGWKPESDQGYVEELQKFTAEELDSAFNRARDDAAKYGNYDYLLNYLRNPELYNGKPKKNRFRRRSKKSNVELLRGSENIGGLKADWLNDGSGTKEGDA